MYRMAHLNYLEPNSQEGGAVYPWYGTTYLNSLTPDPRVPLGAMWELGGNLASGGGNAFMYVRSLEGLSQGQLVSWVVPTVTVSTGTVSTSSTLAQATSNITTTRQEVGNLLYVANTTTGGGGKTFKRIKKHTTGATTTFVIAQEDNSQTGGQAGFGTYPSGTADDLYRPLDPDAFPAAPTSTNVAAVIRPFTVGACIATTVPCGVALGTVSAGYYTVIQVSGIGLILLDGTVTAVAAGEPCVPDAAGNATGATTGLTPYMGGGSIIAYNAYVGAAALQPCQFNFHNNI